MVLPVEVATLLALEVVVVPVEPVEADSAATLVAESEALEVAALLENWSPACRSCR